MKKLAFISIIFLAMNFISGCTNTNKQTTKGAQMPKGGYYTCEMDTDVHSDTPGKCPKCGMELISSEKLKEIYKY